MDNYGHVCRFKTNDERAKDDEDPWMKAAKYGGLVSAALQFLGLVALFIACIDRRMPCLGYLVGNYFLAAFGLCLTFLRWGTDACPSCSRHPAEGSYTAMVAIPMLYACSFLLAQMPGDTPMIVAAIPQQDHDDEEEKEEEFTDEICKDKEEWADPSSASHGRKQHYWSNDKTNNQATGVYHGVIGLEMRDLDDAVHGPV